MHYHNMLQYLFLLYHCNDDSDIQLQLVHDTCMYLCMYICMYVWSAILIQTYYYILYCCSVSCGSGPAHNTGVQVISV